MSFNEILYKIDVKYIEKNFNIKIFGLFSYGSFVYKNKEPEDLDFIVISDEYREQTSFFIDNIEIQLTFYTLDLFKVMLEDQEITALECKYLPENIDGIIKYKSTEIDSLFLNHFIDKQKLRTSISKKTSNSYVKAKKKLILDNDRDLSVSLKSLWHSFRMIDYGIQICEHNKIIDFKNSNALFKDISNDYKIEKECDYNELWNKIHLKYKPIHNNKLSDFKKLAPKKIK